MFGWGEFDVDMEEGLVMRCSALYGASLPNKRLGRTGADRRWLDANVHKEMIQICAKFNDRKWFKRDQNCYCVWYACQVLFNLLDFVGPEAVRKILDIPQAIQTLIALWEGGLYWFEARAAAKAIASAIREGSGYVHKWSEYPLFKTALTQYHQCIQTVLKDQAIVPSKIRGYIQDLMLKANGMSSFDYCDETLTNIAVEMACEWKRANGTLLSGLSAAYTPQIAPLFDGVTGELLERALAMDLCWFVRPRDDGSEGDSCLDAIINLSKHEKFARMLAESRLIVQSLIMKLRCRGQMHLRLDLIVYNLLRFDVVDIRYYRDLCVSLLPLLEFDRKYRYVRLFKNHNGNGTVFDTVVKCLKLLFAIPEFEFVDKKASKKFVCASCNSLLKIPMKLGVCKHKFCYICVIFNKIDTKNFKCPIDSKTCSFYTAKHERYDYQTMNAINSAPVSIAKPSPCTGSSQQLWMHIKNDATLLQRANELDLSQQFEFFCDFMIKESKIRIVAEEKELRNQSRLLRLQGNEYFKQEQYQQAVDCYRQALELCPNLYSDDRCVYYSNLALSYSKMDDHLRAYESCLFGLAQNPELFKLGNNLRKCYQELNTSDLFAMDVEDAYLQKVQNVILRRFYLQLRGKYVVLKLKQDKKLSKETDDEIIDQKLEQCLQNDGVAKSLTEELNHYAVQCDFVTHFFRKYEKAYTAFKKERNKAKKEILDFTVHVLKHKQEFWEYETAEAADNEEWTLTEDLLDLIDDRFTRYLEPSLLEVENNEQVEQLIAGFSFGASQSRNVPVVILELIHAFIFHSPQFNYHKIDAWGMRSLVDKTKRVVRSSDAVVERDDNRLGAYGLKLNVDAEGDEEFSDYDSGVEEWRTNSDF